MLGDGLLVRRKDGKNGPNNPTKLASILECTRTLWMGHDGGERDVFNLKLAFDVKEETMFWWENAALVEHVCAEMCAQRWKKEGRRRTRRCS